jgi:beta-phosphoglucomutase-like phosphatase (HAD superfamily)
MLPPNALVLFDIDGTLVRRAGPHHRIALVEAIRRVTRLETTTEGVPVAGMLDPRRVERLQIRFLRLKSGTRRVSFHRARSCLPGADCGKDNGW